MNDHTKLALGFLSVFVIGLLLVCIGLNRSLPSLSVAVGVLTCGLGIAGLSAILRNR